MADAPPAIVQWGEFSQLAAVPAQSKVAVATAPDGRSLSILLEGLEARCEGGSQRAATAVLVGSIDATIPAKTVWTATRADFRGQVMLKEGARATVVFGMARGTLGETFDAPPQEGGGSIDFVRSVYSSVDTAPPKPGSETTDYGPVTITVQLTLACPGDSSSALAGVDSIDLALWTQ